MKLPSQKCPHTEKRHCQFCGPFSGWINLKTRSDKPTREEWEDFCLRAQARHDDLRQQSFDKLKLVDKV